ncbi:MAG: hypothetical protein RLZZ227_2222 [Pseudomonadota bacterium]
MNNNRKFSADNRLGLAHALVGLALAGAVPAAQAQLTASNFALVPPLITEAAAPNVMLVLSDDHELYKKAYSDFTDITGDGVIDDSYIDSFSYSGYFDSNFCYTYDGTDGRFEPAANISAQVGTAAGHSCNSAGVAGDWSGNFLNWASMTRMDIVRHVLFGGYRFTDTATSGATAGVTVLERVFLPEDVHSFVKVFTGLTQLYTPLTLSAISLCNTTFGAATNAPVLRIGNGSWPLWASAETVQCHYRSENSSSAGAEKPQTNDRPATFSYNARVQVCVPSLDATAARCKAYTNTGTGATTYKPIGLLQRYGDNGNIRFGLISGSYARKISGGVLRKNILPLTGNAIAANNEISTTDGTFLNQTATSPGIINSINRMKLMNWSYTDNYYTDCNTFSITKASYKASVPGDGDYCGNWGNPLSEIYLEALRYFAGDNVIGASANNGLPTPAFNTNDSSYYTSLPQLSWTDPLDGANSCATCAIIVLSTGLNSFDDDGLASVSDLWKVAGTTRMSATDLNTIVNSIGTLESLGSGTWLVGENGTINDGDCTAKAITSFSSARGICPEVGNLEGGYKIAGLAYHAYTKDQRSDFAGLQNVSTYSVALAQNLPSYSVTVNNKRVTFVPICEAGTANLKLNDSGWTDCSFVNAKIEAPTAAEQADGVWENGGRMNVAWEDSLWGNDFDMDAIGRVEWCIGVVTAATVDDLCPGETPNADYDGGALNGNGAAGSASRTGHGYNTHWAWKTTGLSADSIQFRVSLPQKNAANAMKFGMSISGVTDLAGEQLKVTNAPTRVMSGSGTYCVTNALSPNNATCNNNNGALGKYIVRLAQGNGKQFLVLGEGGYTISRVSGSTGNRMIFTEPVVYTASAVVSGGKVLPNPLHFTSKYGSFNDIDGDGTPRYNNSLVDNREWDTRNVAGTEVADGIPDSFFPVTNPNELASSLQQVFEIISSRISSGTAAAVVANSSTGLGSVYQAYYHPEYIDDSNASISWGGVLHSMFIDDSGRFREDNGTPGKLDGPNTDYVIDIRYDTSVSPNRTRFQRYTQAGSGVGAVLTPLGSKQDLEEIGSIWNARDVLADISQADLVSQRTTDPGTSYFTQDAGARRYIFTYLDKPASGTVGKVDSGEVVDFVHANFDPAAAGSNNYRYLGLTATSEATNLVKYIRGQDQPGWRSRLVDIPGDGTATDKYWLLGDIVHSSPLVVNPPSERYDILNGDVTYEAFKQQYQRRRQMIYTGGNDGMLHAFNGGIWDAVNREFQTRRYNSGTGLYTVGQSHELGAEMWGFIPMSLLPHLQWLRQTSYPHVYYMDAPPQAFDVNIFANDATHPNGWGTILVAGMRLGGGDFPVDLDGNGSTETTMMSSYVILDITDPEKAPELIAEISAPDMGFTTSMPTLIKSRIPGSGSNFASPSENQWMLVFGSGPDTLTSATSTGQDAKLFAYDLVARERVNINPASQTPLADPAGFFGDLRAADWDSDYIDDVIYVGTAEGSELAPTGKLKRVVLDRTKVNMGLPTGHALMSLVLDVAKPITAAPAVISSVEKNERWILFGTGRLFTTSDNRSTTQQSYYGIKETATYNTSAVTLASLVNATPVLVETDGDIWNGAINTTLSLSGTSLPKYTDLYNFMDSKNGWVRHFTYSTGVNPSERVFNSALVLGSTAVFTTYKPNPDLCTVEGNGYLYALNFRTGTAEAFGPFGANAQGIAYASIDLGQGAPSAPTAVVRTGDDAGVDASNVGDISIVTGSTTGVTNSTGFSSAPTGSGRVSWEELEVPF